MKLKTKKIRIVEYLPEYDCMDVDLIALDENGAEYLFYFEIYNITNEKEIEFSIYDVNSDAVQFDGNESRKQAINLIRLPVILGAFPEWDKTIERGRNK